jgi:hypothetical protein
MRRLRARWLPLLSVTQQWPNARFEARTEGKSRARWDPRGGCPSSQGEGRSLPRSHEVTAKPWNSPPSRADLRRTHRCPPDRWTPLTRMPLTRAPRRTRSTRVGSVSSSSRSRRGRRAFRSWSVFTRPPIWGDSSAANPVRGEPAPLGSARILPSAWSWHRPEERLAVGER